MCPWERKSICKSPSSQTRIEESRRSVLASSISGKFMSVQKDARFDGLESWQCEHCSSSKAQGTSVTRVASRTPLG